MSLYGALFSGVSGLQVQSSAMGAIADNVTNVNTVGYKNTEVQFATLITKQTSVSRYSAGGVQSKPRQGVDVQGLLQSTNSTTDVAISGGGFFVVNEAANPTSGDRFAYTRAGSFKVDKEGYLQNTSGYYMQGWPLQTYDGNSLAAQVTVGDDTYMKAYKNASGETTYINDNLVDSTNLQPINLNTIGGTAVATTTTSFGANLPAGATVGSTEQANILIYDSLGIDHNLDITWSKKASNAWNADILPPEGSSNISVKDQDGDVYSASGRLDFLDKPDDAETMTINAGGTAFTFTFSDGGGNNNDITANDSATIEVGSTVTLSQMLDTMATYINAALTKADGGTVPSPPGSWAERLSGTSSIIMRQFSNANDMTVTATMDSANSSTGKAVQQSTAFTVSQMDAAIDWTTTGQHFVEFNGDGTPDRFFEKDESTNADPRMSIEIDWVNGAEDMDGSTSPAISGFLGNYNIADGLTQFSGAYQINYISQNGSKFGNYAGLSIAENGVVSALFDNGVVRPIYQIPVTTFVNPNGMEALTGNVWIETDNSGQPTVREAGDAGAGTTNAASLESSTVDIGEEFTTMITTQRAYSAAAKIISTSDEMLEELMSVKR